MAVETLRNGKKAAVLEALRNGNTRRAACRAVGICPDTLYRWMREDPTLSDAILKAEAEAEQFFLGHIKKAAPESWQAAAWYLERRLPQDYARKDTLTLLQKLGAELNKLPDDQLLAAALGGGDPAAVGIGAVSPEGDTTPDE